MDLQDVLLMDLAIIDKISETFVSLRSLNGD